MRMMREVHRIEVKVEGSGKGQRGKVIHHRCGNYTYRVWLKDQRRRHAAAYGT
jgi:hypothetical protein